MNNQANIKALDELDKFLKNTFKRIDPNNQLGDFTTELRNLRESIIGRKIRVAFIGNMNVGKSTVLNAIVGEEILPTNCNHHTYRGIIIRHKKGEPFKLYKTRIIKRGAGRDEYYYFEDEKEPYREGIKEIKNYLTIKNKDKDIEDLDAYLVITGNLKIFDFVDFGVNSSKIEFIDLPGIDIEDNNFMKNDYYDKILKFSNCCIFVNEPGTIDDKISKERILGQYLKDRNKVLPNYRIYFINTCLFLINKSDILPNIDNNLIKTNIFNYISSKDNTITMENINISYFSGLNFLKYLNVKSTFVELLEKQKH